MTALKYLRENRGRSLLIAGIVLMWVVLGILFNGNGYEETWQLWGVPTEMPPFKDFRLIPGSAESFRNGFEPSITNPGDPNGRIFNYPAFWRLFFYTNITEDDTIWISVLMILLFFLGIVLFPQEISIPGAFWMLLIIFSPASMLLYERGNADLIIFFICALIILAVGYSSRLTLSLVLFGAVVKMFPFFGMTVFLKESKRKFYMLLAVGIVFMVVYSILTAESQSAAWNTTMRGNGISYGAFVLITRFNYYAQFYLPEFLSFTQWMILFEALAIFLILLAAIPAVLETSPLVSLADRNLAAFRMGASIYVGTFLLGNNWDYRLAFLVFVIPQLSEWFHLENRRHRDITIGVMVAIILSCWHFVFLIDFQFIPFENEVDRMVVFDEFVNWLLLMGFSYLLVVSSPEWLRQDLQKLLGRFRPRSAGA